MSEEVNKSKKFRKIKVFILVIVLIAVGVGGYIYNAVSGKNDLAFQLALNCEENTVGQLVNPNSFSFSKIKVSDWGRSEDAKEYEANAKDFHRQLIKEDGYSAKSYLVSFDFLSKNRFNSEIKGRAICKYIALSKGDHILTPSIEFLAVNDRIISRGSTDWLLNVKDLYRNGAEQKRKLFFNKLRYSSDDISFTDMSMYSN